MDSHSYRFLCFQKTQSLSQFSSWNIISLNFKSELCLHPLYINSCNDMGLDYFYVISVYRPGKNTQVLPFHS